MKHLFFLTTLFLSSTTLFSQSNEGNVFEESFSGMFATDPSELEIAQNVGMPDPGDPSVPLDGGLTALLVAGGAVGYRKFRAHKQQRTK